MFGVGLPELAVIAFVAVLVFGPDKLPEFARQAGRMARKVREFANEARDELREELGPEFADLDFKDLDPRTIVRKHIIEAMNDDEPDEPGHGRRSTPLAEGELPPWDEDATYARTGSRSAPALHRGDRVAGQQEGAPLPHGDLDEVGSDPGQHHRSRAVPSMPWTTHGSPASASRRRAEPNPSRATG